MALTVVGVRHGEVHNPAGVIYSGLPGYVLSDLGRRQAADVGEALAGGNVVALYASPLERAMETAGAVAGAVALEIRPDDRLLEWKYWQQWAGMTWDELRTKGREAWDAYQHDPGSLTTGESLAELADRVGSWLEDVRATHDDGVVVAVTHLEPLRAILLRLLGRSPKEMFDIQIGLGRAVHLSPEPDANALNPQALHRFVVALKGAAPDFG
jgi:broad specificity phosphatase PhoE